MSNSQKEDYRILATLSFDASSDSVKDVVCKVYVPKRTNESARVILLPTEEQDKQLRRAHMLSLHAELKQPNGDVNLLTSSQALIVSHKSTHWGPKLSENVVTAEPWDLRIETLFHPLHEGSKPEGHFWLARNQLLSNVWEQSFSFTGEVRVGKLDPLEITLANGRTIDFTEHSRYHHLNRDDTLMFGENVAELRIPETSIGKVFEDSLGHIEDVLRLVSFAGEHPCVCVGWSAYNSERVVEFYRSRSVPSREPPSVHDALLNYSDFPDFLKDGYKAFVDIKPNAALRRALDYVVPDNDDSLEASYIILYAAVETLVLFFRRQERFELIFDDVSKWDQLRSDLKAWLKSHVLLSDNKEKRAFVSEKLSELNRLSFGTAFKEFCNHYKVDLSDLWPMVGSGQGDSLSTIRNKLVHGEVYQSEYYHALMGAREHLRWSVYRMIFGMLRWPIERSKIDAQSLARSPIVKSLDEDRRQISR